MVVMPIRFAGGRAHLRAITGVLTLVAALLGAAHKPVLAQAGTRRPQSSADSARLVADLFFRAVADERWPVAASMVDTGVIRRVVAERWRWRSAAPAADTLSVDYFMRFDPGKPRVVAEYELKRYREQMSKVEANPMMHEFAGVRSMEELRSLSALEATARFLQAQDERIQLREQMRAAGCPDSLARMPAFEIHRIVGATLSNDTVAYVLHYEARMEDQPGGGFVFDPMVMQLRLRRDGWRIIPSYGLLRRMNSGLVGVECPNARGRPPG